MAARKRRRAPRRRRRTYRRNQPRQLRGITNQLMQGGIDALQVLAGKAAARTVPQMLGFGLENATGVAMQAVVAIVVGMVGKQFFGAGPGRMMLAGALTAPVESLVVAANIPILSPALSAYPQLGQYSSGYYGAGVGAYPQLGQAPYSPGYYGEMSEGEYTSMQY